MNLGRWWGAAAVAAALLNPGSARADLGHLTADEAVRIALRDNSSVYNAAKQVMAAEGSLASSRTALFPQISATGTISRSHSGREVSDVYGVGPASTSNRRGASIGFGLDALNLETWSTIRQAARSLDATRLGAANTRQAVALAVRQQFYAFVRAKLIARVNAATAGLDSSNLALTQGLFEVGTAPRTDVLKARTTKSQGDLNLITARHAEDIERLRLASLLGLADDRGLDADETLADNVDLPDSTAMIQRSLANRPDYLQLEKVIAASEAGVSAARASRYPSIGFSGGIDKSISTLYVDSVSAVVGGVEFNSPADTSTSKPFGWNVQGRLNFPITDWVWAGGRIKQRQAQLDIDRRNLAQKRVDVGLEVRQGWLALVEARDRLQVAKEQLEYAEQNYELTREKYRLGSSTILDLTTAEVEQTRSRSDLVDARVGLQLAKAQLDKALGVNP